MSAVDISGFTSFLHEAAGRLTRTGRGDLLPQLLRVQVAAVINVAAKYTKKQEPKPAVATAKAQEKLRRKFHSFRDGKAGRGNKQAVAGMKFQSVSSGEDTVYVSDNGKTWFGRGPKGPWRQMNRADRRWPSKLWGEYQAQVSAAERDLKKAQRDAERNIKRSQKLGQKAFLQAGEDLGLGPLLKGDKAARKAVSAAGKDYKNGRGISETGPASVANTIIITAPMLTGPKGKGQAILDRAISTRSKALEIECQKGVFDSLDKVAKRYKGIEVK